MVSHRGDWLRMPTLHLCGEYHALALLGAFMMYNNKAAY